MRPRWRRRQEEQLPIPNEYETADEYAARVQKGKNEKLLERAWKQYEKRYGDRNPGGYW